MPDPHLFHDNGHTSVTAQASGGDMGWHGGVNVDHGGFGGGVSASGHGGHIDGLGGNVHVDGQSGGIGISVGGHDGHIGSVGLEGHINF